MKIAQVDFQNDYGDPKRGVNQHGVYGFFNSFKKLGHDVDFFAYDSYLSKDRKADLQRDLIEFVISRKPELTLIGLFQDQFELETLTTLKGLTRTVCWMGDDTWRFEGYSKQYAPYFSEVITTDHYAVSKYKKLGIESVYLSQWAAMDVPGQELPRDFKPQYEREVAFLGWGNPSRKWMIGQLEKKGIKVQCFGHGWPNGVVSTEKMIEIFQTSKINLNLSNSISHDLRYLLSGPRAMKEFFRSSKNASQIKARNFEIPYWGGFQLSDYVPFLDKYLNIGSEIACFSNLDEAVLQIKYYLEEEEERESIRQAGTRRARADHGYIHRLRKYLEQIPSQG